MRDVIIDKDSLSSLDIKCINDLDFTKIVEESIQTGIEYVKDIEKSLLDDCIQSCLEYISKLKEILKSVRIKRLQDALHTLFQFIKNAINYDRIHYHLNNIKVTLRIIITGKLTG